MAWHPDDPFEDYINIETKQPAFTPDEVAMYNKAMADAFEVCNAENLDIFALAIDIYLEN